MLTISAQVLKNISEKLFENALIESCAIHSRALVKFLYSSEGTRSPQSDDAIAEDFFDDPVEWLNIRPTMSDVLSYANFGLFADKQIAHIVYSNEENIQIIDENKRWDFIDISNAIQPAIEEFIGSIQLEQLGDRWLNQLNDQTGSRWDQLKNLIHMKA